MIQKIHRRSAAGRREPRPVDKRRIYRAARESKAFVNPIVRAEKEGAK